MDYLKDSKLAFTFRFGLGQKWNTVYSADSALHH